MIFSHSVFAASYSLPFDLGSGIFSSCSGSGTSYSCSSDIDISRNNSVTLTSDLTLTISGNLFIDQGNDIIDSGYVFNIYVSGNVDIKKKCSISANIDADGNIDIDKEIDVTGDVTSGGSLDIGKDTVINGTCSPSHSACTGGGTYSCSTTLIAIDGEEFRGISGSSDSNIIAVGRKGSIYHFDGVSWIKNIYISDRDLNGVEVISSNLAYAVGKNGKVVQYDGTSWSDLTAPAGQELMDVWALSSTEVWVVGKKDALYFWDGSSWTDMSGASQASVDNNQDLNGAWGDSSSFYAVEKDGDLYHYNQTGGSWDAKITACNNAYDMEAKDIWGDGLGNIYIAGKYKDANPDEAAIFQYNEVSDSCAITYSSDTENILEGVYGNGSTIYGVGKRGLVFDNSSGSWVDSTDGSGDYKGVWVSSSGTAYYAGKGGYMTVCIPTLDHFVIDVGAGAANACSAFPITITAEDSSNSTVTGYTGTVAITTSSSHGNFAAGSPAPTNNLNPNPDSDDNGSVGYTFDSADNGQIAITISNPHIELLTISVDDASASVLSTSSAITFAEVGFNVTDIDSNALAAGLVVAGRDHEFQIEAVRLDPDNGCGTATGYDGAKDLSLWRSKNADDPSTVSPTLEGYSLPATESGTNSVTFNSGIANATLATTDIGKYEISVADRSGTFTAADIVGNTAEMTVRPFGIGITNIVAGATTNPQNSTSGGAAFSAAGGNFSATVSGVLWSLADDTDNDGVFDTGSYNNNTVAPGYDWDSPWTVSSFTPATGTVGTLTNASFSQGSFSSGAQTVANLTYDEVGSFTFQANGVDFLGTPGVNFSSDTIIVGRFIPATFRVSDNANGVLDEVCTSFTYIGQPFSFSTNPTFVVTALNAGLNPTGNYRDAWVKLDESSITVTPVTQDDTNLLVVNHTPVAMDSATAANDNSGEVNYTFGADTFRYGPAAPTEFAKNANSQIAPFTADITPVIAVVDDGEVPPVNTSQNVDLTGNSLRFGRLRMMNVHGSEINPLNMTVRTEYWDGVSSTFQLNTLDNCTTIANPADLTVSDNLSSGSSTITLKDSTASMGIIEYKFSAPGDGNDGYIDVTTNLSTSGDLWLRYYWDSDSGSDFDDDPSARATFGIYKGNDVNIYTQQVYQ
ncbi:MAG: DUF342 domain-containing protein [Gammaproteobacteria bacterium]|nr:DUF342 domain-containing protein [Gammaproteobacteria bacterium]